MPEIMNEEVPVGEVPKDEKPIEEPIAAEVKKTSTWKAGFLAGIIAAGGGLIAVDQGVIEPQQAERAEFVADSITTVEAVTDSLLTVRADSINKANYVAVAKVVTCRPTKKNGEEQIAGDKFNPLHYYKDGECFIVKGYYVKGKDTTLQYVNVLESSVPALLDVKAKMVPSPEVN